MNNQLERNWKKEFEKKHPKQAKKLEKSFQKDFIKMEKYDDNLVRLTKEFTKRFGLIKIDKELLK